MKAKRIGWKVVEDTRGHTIIAKLEIRGHVVCPSQPALPPMFALGYPSVRKYRAPRAKVLELYDYWTGDVLPAGTLAYSKFRDSRRIRYQKGKITYASMFHNGPPKNRYGDVDPDGDEDCSYGIHFFKTRAHAERWAGC